MTDEQATNPEPEANNKHEPKGIAGWLIIPAIGLVLAPIKSAAMLYMGLSMIQSFAPELTSDSRLWLVGLIDVAMIVATIIVAVFFFKKRRVAVRAIIGLMVASILASVVQALLNAAMFEGGDADTFKPVIHACVFGAVWIPYFLKSKRVKNTFIG